MERTIHRSSTYTRHRQTWQPSANLSSTESNSIDNHSQIHQNVYECTTNHCNPSHRTPEARGKRCTQDCALCLISVLFENFNCSWAQPSRSKATSCQKNLPRTLKNALLCREKKEKKKTPEFFSTRILMAEPRWVSCRQNAGAGHHAVYLDCNWML